MAPCPAEAAMRNTTAIESALAATLDDEALSRAERSGLAHTLAAMALAPTTAPSSATAPSTSSATAWALATTAPSSAGRATGSTPAVGGKGGGPDWTSRFWTTLGRGRLQERGEPGDGEIGYAYRMVANVQPVGRWEALGITRESRKVFAGRVRR